MKMIAVAAVAALASGAQAREPVWFKFDGQDQCLETLSSQTYRVGETARRAEEIKMWQDTDDPEGQEALNRIQDALAKIAELNKSIQSDILFICGRY